MFSVDVIEEFSNKLVEVIKAIRTSNEETIEREATTMQLNALRFEFSKFQEKVRLEKANLNEIRKAVKKEKEELQRIVDEKANIISEYIEHEKSRIIAETAPMIEDRRKEIQRETKMYSDAYDCLLKKYKQARGH